MRFLIASLFLLSLLPAAAQTAPVMTLQDLKEADTLGADLYTNSGATGLVLVVVRGDQVYFKGYGEAVPGSQEAPSLNSEVRLCSLTKIFTTDLLAKLVSDGTVRLDDTLRKYAPEGAVVPEKGAPITLEDLATHTAGLEREIGTAPRRTPHFSYPDYEMRWHWLASANLKFTPGTQAFYSNVGFDLLSDALAKASHTPYDALLDKRTLKPLKMWNTTFYPNPGQCERLMTGAHEEGPCTITANTEGSSGLYSTPADMVKFLSYLVGAGAPAQADDAHGVYLLPSKLAGQYGLDHAGKPSGIGLGWMHVGGNEDVSHIIREDRGRSGIHHLHRVSSREPHRAVCGDDRGAARMETWVQPLQGIEQWVACACRAATVAGRANEKSEGSTHGASYGESPREESGNTEARGAEDGWGKLDDFRTVRILVTSGSSTDHSERSIGPRVNL